MKSHILRTDETGSFSVDSLLDNGEMIISLPHRVSLTLNRFGSVVRLNCDLGLTSSQSDFCPICEIDISKKNYQSAIRMNRDFVSLARSFDNNFQIEKFIRARNIPRFSVSPMSFGEEWQDQVYIHLLESDRWEEKINLEFSAIQANYINLFGEQCLLSEPIRTLVASLRLRGKRAHYFLFVEWWGNEFWSYQKNFFFNDTEFIKIKEEERYGKKDMEGTLCRRSRNSSDYSSQEGPRTARL